MDNLPEARDNKGRFISGNNGGGRKKGSRNKLTESFLSILEKDFAKNGATALAKVRDEDPSAYLKLIANLVPKDLILRRELEVDYTQLSFEEFIELVEQKKQNYHAKQMIGKFE